MALETLFLSPWVYIIIAWELVWKGIAMWKAGRNNHLVWYICILLINLVGLVPIIYLAFFQKKGKHRR